MRRFKFPVKPKSNCDVFFFLWHFDVRLKELLFFFLLFPYLALAQKPPADYVNLFLGTGGDHGQLDPAASLPFGMVKPGPDTYPGNHGGYDFYARRIKGFSINRTSGTGCLGAGGNIRLRPANSVSDTNLTVDKTTEKAEPGFYTVTYSASRIKTEITAQSNTAFFRFTYPQNGQMWLYLDPASSFEKLQNYDWKLVGKRTIKGSFQAGNVCNKGSYKQYYSLQFNQDITDNQCENGLLKFKFENSGKLEARVFVSSIANQVYSSEPDLFKPGLDFDPVRSAALGEWNAKLSVVKLDGKEEDKILFYTFLYRTLLSPFEMASPGAPHQGTNGEIYTSTHTHYNSWSLWDTYRTKFPLFTFLYPQEMKDMARSIIRLYKEKKVDWATDQEPVPTVRTEHAVLVILDAYEKQILAIQDLKDVFPFLVKETETYLQKSPDQKLEAAYDFWALSRMAGHLGRKEDEALFRGKYKEYKKVYKEKFAVMDSKSDIMHGDGLYEGTRWQFRWAVPFDIPGMMEAMG